MKKTIFIFITCLVAFAAIPCLNYYYSIDGHGHFHYEEDVLKGFNINFNIALNERRIKESLRELESTHYFMHLSDYAVKLMNLGKANVALEILKVLNEKYPNEYRLASNLGTAYELNGDNANAIKWIKRGLELNPNDHAGSEWVHVKILEAKIKMATEPNYLERNSLLALTNTQKSNPIVARQINIQVRERFPFSPGPNKIMVALLTEMADCYAESISLEYAIACYRIARDYYGGSEAILNPRIEELKTLLLKVSRDEVPDSDKDYSRREGQHEPLKNIIIDRLLDDNNKEGLKPDWTAIETNVEVLLALVDFGIESKEIRTAENQQMSANDSALKLIPDEEPITKEPEDSLHKVVEAESKDASPNLDSADESGTNYWLIGGLAGFILVLIFVFLKRKRV